MEITASSPLSLPLHAPAGETADLPVSSPSLQRDSYSRAQPLPPPHAASSTSWWGRIQAWWSPPLPSAKTTATAAPEPAALKPIGYVPALETPMGCSADRTTPPLSPKTPGKLATLDPQQLREAWAHMHSQTLEGIVHVIQMAQLELEKDHTLAVESTLSRYQKCQKSHLQRLETIKELLARDQQLAGYLSTAKEVSLAASALCSAVTVLISAQLVSHTATSLAAVLTALTSGGDAYFKRRSQEDQAEHARYSHLHGTYTKKLGDAQDDLIKTAECWQNYEERMFRRLQAVGRLSSSILKR